MNRKVNNYMFDENWQDIEVSNLNEMMKYIKSPRLINKVYKYMELKTIPKHKADKLMKQLIKEYTKNKNKINW